MAFFQTIAKSVYDREFYRTIPEKGLSSALKHFVFFIALVSVVIGVVFSVWAWWSLEHNSKLQGFRTQLESMFPEELVLHFDKDGLSTNVEEPFAIALPEAWRDSDAVKLDEMPKNLLVINTSKPIESTDFASNDTMIILSKNQVGAYNPDEKKVEIQTLGGMEESFTLDKAEYLSIIATVAYYIKVIVIVLLCLSPLLIFLFLLPAYAFYLLFGALIVWLAAKFKGVLLTYGQAYMCGLYLLTLPVLYETLAATLLPALAFPFDATIILFAVALTNFSQTTVEPASVQTETHLS